MIITRSRRNRGISRSRRIPSIQRVRSRCYFQFGSLRKFLAVMLGMYTLDHNVVRAYNNKNPSIDPVHCLQHWMDVKRNVGPFTLSIDDQFGAPASALASCLINWGFNPFSEQLAKLIKKSKQLNLSNSECDIAALKLVFSVNAPYFNRRKLFQPVLVSCWLLSSLKHNQSIQIPTGSWLFFCGGIFSCSVFVFFLG